MLLATLCTGEQVHRYQKAIVLHFNGRRRVLSTAALGGGYREDLQAVFNQDCTRGAGIGVELEAPTYEGHLAVVAARLGLAPAAAAGLSTAAQMENVCIRSERWGDSVVTAIVTGGVDINGGRVGDPADWDEQAEDADAQGGKHGTINILLHFGIDLSPDALARALVTCTEAKTAALQELLAPSRYSCGIATGSGTDGTIVVANMDSPLQLHNAGKHSKLGELIGRAVTAAVKEALRLQTGLCPAFQHHVLRRTDRYGITEEALWARYRGEKGGAARARFADRAHRLLGRGQLVAAVSLYVHLMDQVQWGLLSPDEAMAQAGPLLVRAGMPPPAPWDGAPRDAVQYMADTLADALAELLLEEAMGEIL